MALIVETGSGAANANSYVALDAARTLADMLYVALPADDATAESALVAAARFLEGFRDQFKGSLSNGSDQALCWPRSLADIGGFEVGSDSIPYSLKCAQVAAASLIGAGSNLTPNSDGRFVTKKDIDGLVTEYSEKLYSTPDGSPRWGIVDAYLRPLLIERKGSRLGAY
jgi:hypothetical protein